MEAKTILIIAAVVAAAYFLYKKKSEENTNDTNNTNDSGSSNSSSGSETAHEPVVTTKTTTQRCPYCGAYGAKVITTYTDGVKTNTEVQCGSKSCTGKPKTGTSKKFEKTSSIKLSSSTGTKTNSAR